MPILVGADAHCLNQASRAVFVGSTQWPNGETIRIAFIGGTTQQKAFVEKTANQWLKYANLIFAWDVPTDQSDVRIAFEKDKGSWSYMGRQARSIAKDRSTMNLGWLSEQPNWTDDSGTILHEFGHMLGLAHEHCSPNGSLTWKREVVVKALSGPPNNWSEATIAANVFAKYKGTEAQLVASAFDASSIMLYSFPAEWTEEGVATKANDVLSRQDKAMVAQMYPKDGGVNLDDGAAATSCGCKNGFVQLARAIAKQLKK